MRRAKSLAAAGRIGGGMKWEKKKIEEQIRYKRAKNGATLVFEADEDVFRSYLRRNKKKKKLLKGEALLPLLLYRISWEGGRRWKRREERGGGSDSNVDITHLQPLELPVRAPISGYGTRHFKLYPIIFSGRFSFLFLMQMLYRRVIISAGKFNI